MDLIMFSGIVIMSFKKDFFKQKLNKKILPHIFGSL